MEIKPINKSFFTDKLLKYYNLSVDFDTWVIDGITICMPKRAFDLYQHITDKEGIVFSFTEYVKGFEKGYKTGVVFTPFDNEKIRAEKIFIKIFSLNLPLPSPEVASGLLQGQNEFPKNSIYEYGREMGIVYNCFLLIAESPLYFNEIWPIDSSIYKDRHWQMMKKLTTLNIDEDSRKTKDYSSLHKNLISGKYIESASQNDFNQVMNFHQLPGGAGKIKWLGKKTEALYFQTLNKFTLKEFNKCFIHKDGKQFLEGNRGDIDPIDRFIELCKQ